MIGNNKQAVIEEMNGVFNDANKRQLFVDKIISKNYIINDIYCLFKHKYQTWMCSHIDILFCSMYIKSYGVVSFDYNDNNKPASYNSANKYERCGIEVLKEVNWRDKYDKNKKCIHNFYTNQELKERCKMNKIKGYSKMKKLELIKSLMNI